MRERRGSMRCRTGISPATGKPPEMMNRNKNDIRRQPVLSDEQGEGRLRTAPYRRTQRNKLTGQLIPFVVLAIFGVIIAQQEVPAFAQWWEKLVAPREWQAKQQCQQAALARASRPAFARVVKPGRVHRTEDGLYVERVVLGEMSDAGAEQSVEYSCYLDSAGNLVKLNRL